jgi:uncharacterized protein YjdB
MKNLLISPKVALALIAFFFFQSCDTSDMEDNQPQIVSRIEVSPVENVLSVGGTKKFTAIAFDQNGQAIDKLWIDWGSSSEQIATVNTVGLVSAVTSGETQITASARGVSGSALIKILPLESDASRITKLVISETEVIIGKGKSKKLTGSVFDQYDVPLSDMELSWHSSDHSIVTIDAGGMLTGIKAGEAKIQMRVGKYRSEIPVIVSEDPSEPASIVVSPQNIRSARGETTEFTALVLDQYGVEMDDVNVIWSTNNGCAVSITTLGQAIAVSAGHAEIVASVGKISGKGNLNVALSPITVPSSINGKWLVCSPTYKGILELEKEVGSDMLTGVLTKDDGTVIRATGSYAGNVLSLRWETLVEGKVKVTFVRGAKPIDQYLLEGIIVEGKETSDITISRYLE